MSDKEARAKFMHDLQIVAKKVISEWQQNRFGENHNEVVELELIMNEIFNAPHGRFPKQQLKMIMTWQSALASSRKRGRAKQDFGYLSDSLDRPPARKKARKGAGREEEVVDDVDEDDEDEYVDDDVDDDEGRGR